MKKSTGKVKRAVSNNDSSSVIKHSKIKICRFVARTRTVDWGEQSRKWASKQECRSQACCWRGCCKESKRSAKEARKSWFRQAPEIEEKGLSYRWINIGKLISGEIAVKTLLERSLRKRRSAKVTKEKKTG